MKKRNRKNKNLTNLIFWSVILTLLLIVGLTFVLPSLLSDTSDNQPEENRTTQTTPSREGFFLSENSPYGEIDCPRAELDIFYTHYIQYFDSEAETLGRGYVMRDLGNSENNVDATIVRYRSIGLNTSSMEKHLPELTIEDGYWGGIAFAQVNPNLSQIQQQTVALQETVQAAQTHCWLQWSSQEGLISDLAGRVDVNAYLLMIDGLKILLSLQPEENPGFEEVLFGFADFSWSSEIPQWNIDQDPSNEAIEFVQELHQQGILFDNGEWTINWDLIKDQN